MGTELTFYRAFDMMMLTNTNGREREKAEWIEIFQQADKRFEVTRIENISSAGQFSPANGLIEVVWRGQ